MPGQNSGKTLVGEFFGEIPSRLLGQISGGIPGVSPRTTKKKNTWNKKLPKGNKEK